MKIEVGKIYKDRRGEIAHIAKMDDLDTEYPFVASGGACYTEDGRFLCFETSESDLVEEFKCQNCEKLEVAKKELLEVLESAREFIGAMQDFCGSNLEVTGWHLNGDTEPFDSFVEDNLPDVEAIDKLISKHKENSNA